MRINAVVWLLLILTAGGFRVESAHGRSLSEDEQLVRVGTGAFSEGFYDIAEREFETFIKDYANHSKFYDVCYLFGKTLLYRGKLKEARAAFSKITTEPNKFEYTDYALFWLAVIEMRLGNLEEAKKQLLWIIKKFPKFVWTDYSHYFLGELELRSNRFTQAESCFRNASLFSKNRELIQSSFFWLGILSWKRRDFGAAADYFHTVWNHSQFLPREYRGYVLLWLAEAELRLGKFDEAKMSYKAFSERFENDPSILEVSWKMGLCEYRLGNADRAIDIFESFRGQSKDTQLILFTHYLRGEILLAKGDYGSSIRELNALLNKPQANGLRGGALLLLYWDYVHLGELDEEANRIFQRLQKLDHFEDEKMVVQYLNAEMTSLQGRIPDSLPYFFNIVNTSYRERVLFQIGRGYFFEQKFREAVTNLDILSLEYPNSKYREESIFIKGECLTQLGNVDQALGTYELLLKDTRSPLWQLLGLTQMGNIYLSRHENDKAEVAFKRILQSTEDHPLRFNAALQLGNLYSREENISGAVHCYSLVLKGNRLEFFGEVYFRLGELFHRQGKYDKALACYQAAIRHAKENSSWFFLSQLETGNLQRRREKYDEAKKSYLTVFGHCKDEEINRAAEELLNRLEL